MYAGFCAPQRAVRGTGLRGGCRRPARRARAHVVELRNDALGSTDELVDRRGDEAHERRRRAMAAVERRPSRPRHRDHRTSRCGPRHRGHGCRRTRGRSSSRRATRRRRGSAVAGTDDASAVDLHESGVDRAVGITTRPPTTRRPSSVRRSGGRPAGAQHASEVGDGQTGDVAPRSDRTADEPGVVDEPGAGPPVARCATADRCRSQPSAGR